LTKRRADLAEMGGSVIVETLNYRSNYLTYPEVHSLHTYLQYIHTYIHTYIHAYIQSVCGILRTYSLSYVVRFSLYASTHLSNFLSVPPYCERSFTLTDPRVVLIAQKRRECLSVRSAVRVCTAFSCPRLVFSLLQVPTRSLLFYHALRLKTKSLDYPANSQLSTFEASDKRNVTPNYIRTLPIDEIVLSLHWDQC
jgi:hypothetical protein